MIRKKEVNEVTLTQERAGKEISFASGKLAPHCDGSVKISMGETTLLVTAVMEKQPDKDKGWFPLAIDYRESNYAAGKIGGGRYRKREGRPSDDSILYARLTDRPLRPMFPDGMVNDVVITISPMQLDQVHSPGELSIIASSLAVMLAGIPFAGPVSAVRVGYIDGEYILNMTNEQAENSVLDLHVAGTKEKINMLEAGGDEAPIDVVKGGIKVAQKAIKECCELQEQFLKNFTIEQKEITYNKPAESLIEEMKKIITPEKLEKMHGPISKNEFNTLYDGYINEAKEALADQLASEDNDWKEKHVGDAFFKILKERLREKTISEKLRIDGRGLDDIRKIHCEIDLFERVHGTGLFRRGDTQVLSVLTLGSPGDAEIQDDMEHDQAEKKWMHHYKMPPFSNNEARMIRFTNRREVGHGRLAEKAMEPMLPDDSVFPYTMRMVSEVLGSGGSTSMASVCGATLALMAGGVPIKKPVSGIAMGLMGDDDNQVILTDIKGTEDFTGDLDFKLAGTDEGMTAIQMDTKLHGVKVSRLEEMLDKAQEGRKRILAYMLQTIDTPRSELNQYAPSIVQFKVEPDQVRDVIGPGGSVIQEIIRETGVKIDLEDDGSGTITADDQLSAQEALKRVKAVVWSPEVGDKITGDINRVEKYGVFVDLGNKKTGLAHVKHLGEGYIEDVSALYKVGDTLKVEVTGIDDQGKIQLKKVD